LHLFIDTTAISKLEKANATNKCQKIMFASMSHEFRTPLNSINAALCFTDRWLNSHSNFSNYTFTPKEMHSLTKFTKIGKISCITLMNLIEDILDLAKIDSGNFLIHEREFDIREMAREIEYIFGYQCDQKKVEFNINLKLDEYKMVSDSTRIKQVLINLLSNSVKFTMKGMILLDIEKDGNQLIITVTDTGIGIKDEDQHKLFKLFGTLNENSDQNVFNTQGIAD
jgi:signal transduction histidine kinase